MKESIENSIKKSLENYELPYNADAWKAMSAKLDAKQPVAKPRYKWYIAASAVAVLSTCAYLYHTYGNDNSIIDTKQEIAINNDNVVENNTSVKEVVNNDSNSITDNGSSTNDSNNSATNTNIVEENNETNTSSTESNNTQASNSNESAAENTANNANEGSNESNQKQGGGSNEEQATEVNFIMPLISSVCQGTKMQINNENNVDITVVYPNGLIWTGKANASTTLNPSLSGTYQVGYLNKGEMVKGGTFQIADLPNPDFQFVNSDEKYDEFGLPATSVLADASEASYKWKMGQAFSEGRNATGHFFKKGNYDVTLTVTDNNGCEASQSKQVNIEEDYNLMAMNSFVPTDIDPAVNTFMPYSLKVRGDEFHMIIIDPSDGHLIYETRDASKGWDGIDKQTGAMVKYESAYIWKVTIENRKVGESPEYAGTVVPLSTRR